jgi:hypothetical protein
LTVSRIEHHHQHVRGIVLPFFRQLRNLSHDLAQELRHTTDYTTPLELRMPSVHA